MKNVQVYAIDRIEWRDWLKKNHKKLDEAWLIYYKKDSGKPSITYMESVEEAICFGWIDGIKKRIDEKRYTYRFTPRRPNSKWSQLNIQLAEKLTKSKQMTKAGLEAFNQKKEYKEEIVEMVKAKEIELTPEIEKELKSNQKAWHNYNKLAPSYRKQYAAWLTSAKRTETLRKRIAEAISLLEKNEKLGMK